MAEATAVIGYGTVFAIGDGATPEVFVSIAEMTDLNPPADEMDIIETTHMGSPNRTKEFIGGMTDAGSASFDMHFIPGSGDDSLIQSMRNTGLKYNCRITWTTGEVWNFRGLLTNYAPTAPVNDRMTATVTFKLSSSYMAGE